MTKKPLKPLDLSGDDPLDQDFSEYIAQGHFKLAHFNFAPKDRTMTMRLPTAMVDALKEVADREKMPYQSLIRQYLADALLQEAARIRATSKRA
jgi:predicted DNA binding CopG/RHH family protein